MEIYDNKTMFSSIVTGILNYRKEIRKRSILSPAVIEISGTSYLTFHALGGNLQSPLSKYSGYGPKC